MSDADDWRAPILMGRRGVVLSGAALLSQLVSGGPAVAQGGRNAKGKFVLAWHTAMAPRWIDPQEHDGAATPDNFLMALQDALIKNSGTTLYDHPSLAESYAMAADSRTCDFKLRPGIKFHNGEPVTPEDVKWSYENYRGALAALLKSKTRDVEVVDRSTIRFHFHTPFLDFPLLVGSSNVCGAGWVVPAKYYQQVGPDVYKRRPIGAGPYRLINLEAGVKLEMEAFADYYRTVHIKNFTIIAVPEASTRLAMLERGEADIIYGIPGELLDRVRKNPKFMIAPLVSGSFWLEFPGAHEPTNPFHDKRVREAVSLAIDRPALNEAEFDGFARNSGNWINDDVQYAVTAPEFKRDVARAKQLLAEAGHPNGLTVDWFTANPPFYARGERIVAQLQEAGIRCKLQIMERGAFLQRTRQPLKQWPGLHIIMQGARIGGSWANWYDGFFRNGGNNVSDRVNVPALDAKFAQYQASADHDERKRLAEEVQREILDQHYLVPVHRHCFFCGIGPRIEAQKWQDVFPTVTTGYGYPWEDKKLRG
jgi:peptide/nickel transport system substrate-binding protein